MLFPKIVHLIYIPWNKKQKLKDDYMDFDKTFYHKFRKKVGSEWEVILWTRDKIDNFMYHHYPKEWKYVQSKSARPVMWVDYLRWKLVYHFGGVYWQYGSELHCSLKHFLPPQDGVKLFTEREMNLLFRLYTSFYRIRNGRWEEPLRIATQVFSSYPKNKFIQLVIKRILFNLGKYKVQEDYDILFISGNAMISTVYDEYKSSKQKYKVQLCPLSKTKKLITFSSAGSWRQDDWTYYLPTIFFLFLISVIVWFLMISE